MKFTVNITKLVRHSLCWLVLIFYELLLVYLSAGKFPPLVVYFSYYCCNLCLFYAHVSILTVTLSSDKPRYFKLFFLFVGEMIVILALKLGLDILFLSPVHTGNTKFQDLRLTGTFNLMRNIYYVAFGTLYWAINKINNYQREADAAEISRLKAANENVDLEVKLAKTQNAYLQQQINPHLLFNSLNFIHSSVYKLSPEAAENIILLSDIMRFSLNQSDSHGKIKLADEAEQIGNLVKINQFRFDYPLEVSYLINGVLPVHRMIPLVLMTLAENVFKHGNLQNRQAIIRLNVSENSELSFYTYNYKRAIAPVPRLKSIGIENIKTRLNFTYASHYKLSVNQTDEIYESELIVQL